MSKVDAADGREAARLAELRRLRVLESKPEPEFDLIVETAATLFDVPISLLTLIDAHRQWFKAAHGLALRDTGRDVAFCSHAIADPGRVLIVPDARLDDRFADNPLVTGEPQIRFYAGAPLISSAGYALGTLCVIDRKARSLTARETDALQSLAALTMRLLERRVESEAIRSAANRNPERTAFTSFDWDERGRLSSWNGIAEDLFGWSSADVLGRFPPFVLAGDARRYAGDCEQVLAGRGDVARLCSFRTKSGRLVPVAVSLTRAVGVGGRTYGTSMVEDIGARLATERRLTMLESVVVNSTDAVIVTDAIPVHGTNHRIVFVNEAFTAMTGYSAAEAIGNTPRMLQGPRTDPAELERIARALQRREPVIAQLTNYRKDGSEFVIDFSISPIRDADGWCMYFIAIERDVTQRNALERYEANRALVLEMAVRNERLNLQLERSVVMLKNVIPGSYGTIALLEGDRLAIAAADPALSPEFVAAIDHRPVGPRAGSSGTSVYEREAVMCGDITTDPRWEDDRAVALQAGFRACWSIPLFGSDGDVFGAFALYTDRPMMPTVSDLQFFIETVRFVSLVIERHRDRERLERMVLYDALTDLPNRKLFEDRCGRAIANARLGASIVAVGVLDIDRFKTINDAFGHHVGDQLLRHIAARLNDARRSDDLVARMAGDEFLLLFTGLPTRRDGIETARQLLRLFDGAFTVGGHEIFVRASLGLAFVPDTSTDPFELFAAADKAMYIAKLRGGGLELATSPQAGSALRQLDLENDLRHALERDEFELHYQLMFDLADGRPAGAEALLRWNHATFGMLAPGDFIPLAEANGTIVPIGRWAIDEAARVARRWQDAGRDAFVTVNVSALQFDEPGLVTIVVDALARHGLEPHRLHLELTESLVMRNPEASAAMLLQLKALGVRVVIDDFGTGYSSLAYLQRFSFDALKIDRAFVGGIGSGTTSARSENIVAAVVALGQALGVTTIAEGVENPAQYAFVKSCGCNVVQGFLCSAPVAPNDVDWRCFDLAGVGR